MNAVGSGTELLGALVCRLPFAASKNSMQHPRRESKQTTNALPGTVGFITVLVRNSRSFQKPLSTGADNSYHLRLA